MEKPVTDLNAAWDLFCKNDICDFRFQESIEKEIKTMPKCSELYISTKTIICYLDSKIDINKIFWKLPIIPYHKADCGILKKEIKLTTETKEDLKCMLNIIETIKEKENVKTYIITSIDNINGRIKFKDVRKISIGLCKKDILTTRAKQKSAFYNCFVVILRIKKGEVFKEMHIKVFNTGKLEIPGVQDDTVLDMALDYLIKILNQIENKNITLKPYNETVLINSNFNCNYFIDREKLFNILKYKYNINCSFDSCSYPGIQSKCYYNTISKNVETNETPDSVSISFMIFRTGSVLIVGKSEEYIIKIIYNYLVNIFKNEYYEIYTPSSEITTKQDKVKRNKKIYIKI